MVDKFFFATKALIVRDGKVLLLKESAIDTNTQTGKWGVPGGRLDIGEQFADALRREVKEECGLDIEIGKPVHVDEWRPTVKGENWQIVAVFFECTADADTITLSEEHDDFAWVSQEDLENYNLMKEDLLAINTLWRNT